MADCPEIVTRLGSTEAEALREAAFDAGEARCESAVPLLAEDLRRRLLALWPELQVAAVCATIRRCP